MSVKLNLNERSWAIQIIQYITSYVSNKPDFLIKRAGGETTINTGKNVMFPDVLLFGDNDMSLVLQGWEIKMPDVSINDRTFIEDSWRKARNLGLKSTITWNFRYVVFYVLNEDTNTFKEVQRWDNSKCISTNREDVELYKELWMQTLSEVLDEINRYFVEGKFIPLSIGNAYINNTFEEFIKQNRSIEATYLKEISKKDAVFENYINLWWDIAKKEYTNDEKDKYVVYSKVLLLDWLNKITFAHIIRNRYPSAGKIIEIKDTIKPEDALNIFNEITKKCDFYSIFRKIKYEEYISDIVWQQILEINDFLNGANFQKINQSDMQQLLESSVKTSQRIMIGQYTTDSNLANFMVRIAVNDAQGYCFDPCCGSGTFPRALINYKLERGITLYDTYRTVFAEDKQSFPLQIAGLTTVSKDAVNQPAIIFQKDIFELKVDDIIHIINPSNGEQLSITIPYFDYIVSNLPFIDFYKHNDKNDIYIKAKQSLIKEIKKNTSIELSDRSDVYMYIIFQLWNLLKNKGTACIITSNSWMATSAGELFLNALSQYFTIKGVIKSGNKRWFNNAKIVTSIFILEKKERIKGPSQQEIVRFYLLNIPLKDLEKKEILNKAVGTVLQNEEIDKNIMEIKETSWKDISEFSHLNLSFNIAFYDAQWIINCKNKLIAIKDLFFVFRGTKTGQDEIFITNNPNVADSNYVYPMLKNSKKCETLISIPDSYFITSNKTFEEMDQLGHIKTVNYFKQFENQLNQSVLQHGKLWYYLSETSKKADLVTSINPGSRLFFGRFIEPACINQRLIGLSIKNKQIDLNLNMCHALLNSIIGMLFIEAAGFERGEGVLDLNKDSFEKTYMLNPFLLSNCEKGNILSKFEILKNRKILPVEDELKQKDRKDFDLSVLKAFKIEEYYERIKNCLLKMQRIRLNIK